MADISDTMELYNKYIKYRVDFDENEVNIPSIFHGLYLNHFNDELINYLDFKSRSIFLNPKKNFIYNNSYYSYNIIKNHESYCYRKFNSFKKNLNSFKNCAEIIEKCKRKIRIIDISLKRIFDNDNHIFRSETNYSEFKDDSFIFIYDNIIKCINSKLTLFNLDEDKNPPIDNYRECIILDNINVPRIRFDITKLSTKIHEHVLSKTNPPTGCTPLYSTYFFDLNNISLFLKEYKEQKENKFITYKFFNKIYNCLRRMFPSESPPERFLYDVGEENYNNLINNGDIFEIYISLRYLLDFILINSAESALQWIRKYINDKTYHKTYYKKLSKIENFYKAFYEISEYSQGNPFDLKNLLYNDSSYGGKQVDVGLICRSNQILLNSMFQKMYNDVSFSIGDPISSNIQKYYYLFYENNYEPFKILAFDGNIDISVYDNINRSVLELNIMLILYYDFFSNIDMKKFDYDQPNNLLFELNLCDIKEIIFRKKFYEELGLENNDLLQFFPRIKIEGDETSREIIKIIDKDDNISKLKNIDKAEIALALLNDIYETIICLHYYDKDPNDKFYDNLNNYYKRVAEIYDKSPIGFPDPKKLYTYVNDYYFLRDNKERVHAVWRILQELNQYHSNNFDLLLSFYTNIINIDYNNKYYSFLEYIQFYKDSVESVYLEGYSNFNEKIHNINYFELVNSSFPEYICKNNIKCKIIINMIYCNQGKQKLPCDNMENISLTNHYEQKQIFSKILNKIDIPKINAGIFLCRMINDYNYKYMELFNCLEYVKLLFHFCTTSISIVGDMNTYMLEPNDRVISDYLQPNLSVIIYGYKNILFRIHKHDEKYDQTYLEYKRHKDYIDEKENPIHYNELTDEGAPYLEEILQQISEKKNNYNLKYFNHKEKIYIENTNELILRQFQFDINNIWNFEQTIIYNDLYKRSILSSQLNNDNLFEYDIIDKSSNILYNELSNIRFKYLSKLCVAFNTRTFPDLKELYDSNDLFSNYCIKQYESKYLEKKTIPIFYIDSYIKFFFDKCSNIKIMDYEYNENLLLDETDNIELEQFITDCANRKYNYDRESLLYIDRSNNDALFLFTTDISNYNNLLYGNDDYANSMIIRKYIEKKSKIKLYSKSLVLDLKLNSFKDDINTGEINITIIRNILRSYYTIIHYKIKYMSKEMGDNIVQNTRDIIKLCKEYIQIYNDLNKDIFLVDFLNKEYNIQKFEEQKVKEYNKNDNNIYICDLICSYYPEHYYHNVSYMYIIIGDLYKSLKNIEMSEYYYNSVINPKDDKYEKYKANIYSHILDQDVSELNEQELEKKNYKGLFKKILKFGKKIIDPREIGKSPNNPTGRSFSAKSMMQFLFQDRYSEFIENTRFGRNLFKLVRYILAVIFTIIFVCLIGIKDILYYCIKLRTNNYIYFKSSQKKDIEQVQQSEINNNLLNFDFLNNNLYLYILLNLEESSKLFNVDTLKGGGNNNLLNICIGGGDSDSDSDSELDEYYNEQYDEQNKIQAGGSFMKKYTRQKTPKEQRNEVYEDETKKMNEKEKKMKKEAESRNKDIDNNNILETDTYLKLKDHIYYMCYNIKNCFKELATTKKMILYKNNGYYEKLEKTINSESLKIHINSIFQIINNKFQNKNDLNFYNSVKFFQTNYFLQEDISKKFTNYENDIKIYGLLKQIYDQNFKNYPDLLDNFLLVDKQNIFKKYYEDPNNIKNKTQIIKLLKESDYISKELSLEENILYEILNNIFIYYYNLNNGKKSLPLKIDKINLIKSVNKHETKDIISYGNNEIYKSVYDFVSINNIIQSFINEKYNKIYNLSESYQLMENNDFSVIGFNDDDNRNSNDRYLNEIKIENDINIYSINDDKYCRLSDRVHCNNEIKESFNKLGINKINLENTYFNKLLSDKDNGYNLYNNISFLTHRPTHTRRESTNKKHPRKKTDKNFNKYISEYINILNNNNYLDNYTKINESYNNKYNILSKNIFLRNNLSKLIRELFLYISSYVGNHIYDHIKYNFDRINLYNIYNILNDPDIVNIMNVVFEYKEKYDNQLKNKYRIINHINKINIEMNWINNNDNTLKNLIKNFISYFDNNLNYFNNYTELNEKSKGIYNKLNETDKDLFIRKNIYEKDMNEFQKIYQINNLYNFCFRNDSYNKMQDFNDFNECYFKIKDSKKFYPYISEEKKFYYDLALNMKDNNIEDKDNLTDIILYNINILDTFRYFIDKIIDIYNTYIKDDPKQDDIHTKAIENFINKFEIPNDIETNKLFNFLKIFKGEIITFNKLLINIIDIQYYPYNLYNDRLLIYHNNSNLKKYILFIENYFHFNILSHNKKICKELYHLKLYRFDKCILKEKLGLNPNIFSLFHIENDDANKKSIIKCNRIIDIVIIIEYTDILNIKIIENNDFGEKMSLGNKNEISIDNLKDFFIELCNIIKKSWKNYFNIVLEEELKIENFNFLHLNSEDLYLAPDPNPDIKILYNAIIYNYLCVLKLKLLYDIINNYLIEDTYNKIIDNITIDKLFNIVAYVGDDSLDNYKGIQYIDDKGYDYMINNKEINSKIFDSIIEKVESIQYHDDDLFNNKYNSKRFKNTNKLEVHISNNPSDSVSDSFTLNYISNGSNDIVNYDKLYNSITINDLEYNNTIKLWNIINKYSENNLDNMNSILKIIENKQDEIKKIIINIIEDKEYNVYGSKLLLEDKDINNLIKISGRNNYVINDIISSSSVNFTFKTYQDDTNYISFLELFNKILFDKRYINGGGNTREMIKFFNGLYGLVPNKRSMYRKEFKNVMIKKVDEDEISLTDLYDTGDKVNINEYLNNMENDTTDKYKEICDIVKISHEAIIETPLWVNGLDMSGFFNSDFYNETIIDIKKEFIKSQEDDIKITDDIIKSKINNSKLFRDYLISIYLLNVNIPNCIDISNFEISSTVRNQGQKRTLKGRLLNTIKGNNESGGGKKKTIKKFNKNKRKTKRNINKRSLRKKQKSLKKEQINLRKKYN